MIAVDTSSWVAFLSGSAGKDVEAVDLALAQGRVVLPPVVLSELLSDPKLEVSVARLLLRVPVLEVTAEYWTRAGRLRAGLLGRGHKARLADTLVAQSCIDHQVALIARDGDFRHFVRAGLLLA